MMLSRLALRPGSLYRLGFVRLASTSEVTKMINGCPVYPEPDTSIEARLKNWQEANDLFFNAKRDEKNFPTLMMPEKCPPTRLGFLPASWFENFYEKTGVSGPYLLCFGLTTFLMSKEVLIIEHQFTHFISYWLVFYLICRKWGSKIGQYLETNADRLNEEMFTKPLRDMKEQSAQTIKDLEKVEWQEEGQKYLWESKKENVDLQLESAYRQRLTEVYHGVKKRLDYMVETESLQKRIEQDHMTKWIVDNVIKSITPQQEKDALAKCVADLKALAQKQQATI